MSVFGTLNRLRAPFVVPSDMLWVAMVFSVIFSAPLSSSSRSFSLTTSTSSTLGTVFILSPCEQSWEVVARRSTYVLTYPSPSLSRHFQNFPQWYKSTTLRQSSFTSNASNPRRNRLHFYTPKMSRALLACFGNKAAATFTALLTSFRFNTCLARLLISFFRASSAFRFTPRFNPAARPFKVFVGTFKGLRLFIRPCKPPCKMPFNKPDPSWP